MSDHVKTLEQAVQRYESDYVSVPRLTLRAVLEERVRLISDQEIKYVKLAKLEEENERLQAKVTRLESRGIEDMRHSLDALSEYADSVFPTADVVKVVTTIRRILDGGEA